MEVLHHNLREKRGLDGLVHVPSHGLHTQAWVVDWLAAKEGLRVCINVQHYVDRPWCRAKIHRASPHRFVPPFSRQRSNGREAMSAALTALCKGNRSVRDKARLFLDRVKIWEMQGNARSTQDINASVPAICVWLAAERFVIQAPLTLTRNKSKFECA